MLVNSIAVARDWLGLSLMGFGAGLAIQIIPMFHTISVLGVNRADYLPLLVSLFLGTGIIVSAVIGAGLDQWSLSSRPQLMDLLDLTTFSFVVFTAAYLITATLLPVLQSLGGFATFPGAMIFVLAEGAALVLLVGVSFISDKVLR